MNQLMNEGRSEIVPGTAVKLTDAGQRRLEQTLVHLDPDDEDEGGDAEILDEVEEDDTFYINQAEGNRYQLSYTLSNGRTVLFPLTAGGVENPRINMWFRREHFTVFDEDKNEEVDEETIRRRFQRTDRQDSSSIPPYSHGLLYDNGNLCSNLNRQHSN